MDKIIFGDNQFFGINHMSEEKAQERARKFNDISDMLHVLDIAYNCGIHAFMFSTHSKVKYLCDHFRVNPTKYADLRLYPTIPYVHKYVNTLAEKGAIGTLNKFLCCKGSTRGTIGAVVRGGASIISQNILELLRLLVDAEMAMFQNLNVRAIFLHNIVTDLMLGMGLKDTFIEFADYVQKRYRAEPAFNTMNMPMLVDFLIECNIENPIICSSINKIGYLMSPSRIAYEDVIATRSFRPIAMCFLASGAIAPEEAIKYVADLKKIKSYIFGASSQEHIIQTKNLIEKYCSYKETTNTCR